MPNERKKRKVTELWIPNTAPSPVERVEFRFVAVDATAAEWHRIDDGMVWVRLQVEAGYDDLEADGCGVLQ